MYSNIGDKICKVAKFYGFIGIVCAIIGLFVAGYGTSSSEDSAIIAGIVVFVLGVACLISSWPLYAFGQITNDVHAMRTSAPQKAPAAQFSDLPDL